MDARLRRAFHVIPAKAGISPHTYGADAGSTRHAQAGRGCRVEPGTAGVPTYTLRLEIPQRSSAASSAARASTQRSPPGVRSFFQNGAWVFR